MPNSRTACSQHRAGGHVVAAMLGAAVPMETITLQSWSSDSVDLAWCWLTSRKLSGSKYTSCEPCLLSRSVPPFRLKRFAVPAFLIIATVRGFLLNFGVYYATRAAIGLNTFAWSPAIGCVGCRTLLCTGLL
jgi:hypothetical protein